MNPKAQDNYTQAYNRWVENQTPENMAELVSAFMPTINAEIQQYSGSKELLRSRAKSFVAKAVRSYNPMGPTKLNSWVVTNLRQLSRYGKRLRPIRASEDMIRNSAELNSVSRDLEDRLGRKPTDDELQDETGWSKKTIDRIRAVSVASVSEGGYTAIDSEGDANLPAVSVMDRLPFAADATYASLGENDRRIYDYRLGAHGSEVLNGNEIARKMGVTPAYVSQRASAIARLIAGMGDK